MTAVNCLVWPDYVALFTDSASNIDGEINHIGSKVRLFPNFPAAVSVTGTPFGAIVADRYIGGAAQSFDDLVSTMAACISLAVTDYPEEDWQAGPCDFLAVGWSENAKAFAAYQCAYTPGEDPVTRHAGPLYLQPGTPQIIGALKGVGLDPDVLPAMTVEKAIQQMVLSMQVQRDNAPAGCVIGGYQQLTVITPEIIFTKVAHAWPDQVTFRRDPPARLPGLGG